MKQSDIKTRKVMDFDTFKGAYDRALHPVSRDPDAPLQDGSRKMTAYPSHVRNDSNPYRAFGIPYDKEEADSNMRIMALPPMVQTKGAGIGTGEVGESVKYKGQEVELGENDGDVSEYAPLDTVEIIFNGKPTLVKMRDLEIKENENAVVQDPSNSSKKLNIAVGDKVWTIMGPCAGKDYFGIVDTECRASGSDYVVDVTFYKADNGKPMAGSSEYAVDYLHRIDGAKIY